MATGTLIPPTGEALPPSVGERPEGQRPQRRRQRHRRHLASGTALVILAALVAATVPHYRPGGGPALHLAVTPAPVPGSAGLTVAGVHCAPGVRQLPFSAYSPICVSVWHGANGGATANGVTARTITISYREASTNILSLLYAEIPQSVVGTNAEAINTMEAYIKVFNQYFELYGRKVVLRPYQGQGDFILEDEGSGLAQAQEDALTVADSIHAFADMSLVDSTVIYDDALQQAGVPVFGLYLQDTSWYAQAAPYQYTVGPTCTQSDGALADVLGSPGMANTDAVYAGGSLRTRIRSYGIIYPDNPQADACASQLSAALAATGHPATTAVGFEFNVATLQTAAQNAIGQLKAAGVTTIICASCDPVSPIYFLSAAKAADYYPEFVSQSYFAGSADIDSYTQNILARSGDAAEGQGMLTVGTGGLTTPGSEALKVYEMANHGSLAGIAPSYQWAYGAILYLFDLLQAAGPDLTPATLHQAAMDTAELPRSRPGGSLGVWTFGPGQVDPSASFQLLHWVSGAVSPQDGQRGTYEPCYGGKLFVFTAPRGGVPKQVEPGCPT